MPILKCKMCGANLSVTEGSTTCTCEYCGTTQTVPVLDDEKKNKLYERANRLRFNNEFDKAYNVYQDIINDFPQEAEAYWGLLLCKYGIEYVEDPYSHKRIPTCHRSSFESIFDDELFELVMENCSTDQRGIYRQEAKTIEEIRKGIIEVSNKEESYDIFICYKETDENNNRTIDSVIAQDVYNALTEKGYRVFFSRISLEDKLGQEYEPYIFAALNSAKVMLVFGTKYEYFNAVWVKNEWSRFLQLISKGEKKTLIPCYRDIDVYDMPKEFHHLQSQDMAKVGAIQDLVRGIGKIVAANNHYISSNNDSFGKNSSVYKNPINKSIAKEKYKNIYLKKAIKPLKMKYALMILLLIIVFCLSYIYISKTINDSHKYNNAINLLNNGEYSAGIAELEILGDYKDSKEKINDAKYQLALEYAEKNQFSQAINLLYEISEFNNTKDKIDEYTKKWIDIVISNNIRKDEELLATINKSGNDYKEYIYSAIINRLNTWRWKRNDIIWNSPDGVEESRLIQTFEGFEEYINGYRDYQCIIRFLKSLYTETVNGHIHHYVLSDQDIEKLSKYEFYSYYLKSK